MTERSTHKRGLTRHRATQGRKGGRLSGPGGQSTCGPGGRQDARTRHEKTGRAERPKDSIGARWEADPAALSAGGQAGAGGATTAHTGAEQPTTTRGLSHTEPSSPGRRARAGAGAGGPAAQEPGGEQGRV
ncbi:hypothetical protein WJX82_009422 [Trebouxia sp. C0006]